MDIPTQNRGSDCLADFADVVCHANVSFVSITDGKVSLHFALRLYEADSQAQIVHNTSSIFRCAGKGFSAWKDTFALIAKLCGFADVSQFVRALDLWLLTVKARFQGSGHTAERYQLYFKVRYKGLCPHLVLKKIRHSDAKNASALTSYNDSGFTLVVSDSHSPTYVRLNTLTNAPPS